MRLRPLSLSGSTPDKQLAPHCFSGHEGRSEASRSGDVYQSLITSGVLSKTTPAVVAALSRRLQPLRFPRGRVVAAQSEFDDRIYVIISGKVKVSHRRPDGREIVLTILGPSEIFGAMRVFDPPLQEMSVTTLTEVVAVPIRRDQLLSWMAEHPEVSDQVLRLFARWAKRTAISLVDFASADARSRIASQLLSLRHRFGQREGDVVRIVHDLTLQDFSLLVGASPETIAATLRDFGRRGWIRLENSSVVIVDGQALAGHV